MAIRVAKNGVLHAVLMLLFIAMVALTVPVRLVQQFQNSVAIDFYQDAASDGINVSLSMLVSEGKDVDETADDEPPAKHRDQEGPLNVSSQKGSLPRPSLKTDTPGPTSSISVGNPSPSCKKVPIKVFLLAGQSNMSGRGSIQHLRQLANGSTTRQEFQIYLNGNLDAPKKREDVFCVFGKLSGPLSADSCGPRGPEFKNGPVFGPELGFGWEVGDAMGAKCPPIFIIKTSYGAKNLWNDFRPPSSGYNSKGQGW